MCLISSILLSISIASLLFVFAIHAYGWHIRFKIKRCKSKIERLKKDLKQ